MAYSMYEHSLMKTQKQLQSYPDEYEYSNRNYNHSVMLQSPRATKKNKKLTSHHENNQKCPIYIHKFNRSPDPIIHPDFTTTNETKKHKTKPQNPKLVIDKLEETYWATWKPSKESKTTTRGSKPSENVAEKLIKYFEVSDFPSTSASATEATVKPSRSFKQFETTSQQIQTDDFCPIGISDSTLQVEAASSIGTSSHNEEKQEEIVSDKKAEEEHEETVAPPSENEEKKILNHTDSFIITKKKQNAVREYLQQPRCIKLYKKTTSSFLKGGSYPLRPCLKKETTPKGSFRLGAPGRPLFVTSSSFSKK